MYCKHCSYCIDYLQRNRCPECGREFDPTNPATFTTTLNQSFSKKWMLLIIGLLIIVAVVVQKGPLGSHHTGSQMAAAVNGLRDFAVILRDYANRKKSFPGPGLPEALDVLMKDPISSSFTMHWNLFQRNQSPLGGSYYFYRSPDWKKVIIRDPGPNCRDEAGKGDDLQHVLTIKPDGDVDWQLGPEPDLNAK
jgi:hypothetical protein